jgi:glucuronate isomerase
MFVRPDHYVFRMLYSQGVRLEQLGIPTKDGSPVESDPRAVWRLFAGHYHLFPRHADAAMARPCILDLVRLYRTALRGQCGRIFRSHQRAAGRPEFRPRALFKSFNIEVIATTESPLDPLDHHRAVRDSGWNGRVITAYRPDPVVDPDFEGFAANLERFGEITGCDTQTWSGYLEAHRNRREYFRSFGATSTDHGHPTAGTADLSAGRRRRCSKRSGAAIFLRRSRAVPRPDADRDGAHER